MMCAAYRLWQPQWARNRCVALSFTPAQRLFPVRMTCMAFPSLTSGPDKSRSSPSPLRSRSPQPTRLLSRMRSEKYLSPSPFSIPDPVRKGEDCLHLARRDADSFLGVPLNLILTPASYALCAY